MNNPFVISSLVDMNADLAQRHFPLARGAKLQQTFAQLFSRHLGLLQSGKRFEAHSLLVTGPSGTGKTTEIDDMLQRFNDSGVSMLDNVRAQFASCVLDAKGSWKDLGRKTLDALGYSITSKTRRTQFEIWNLVILQAKRQGVVGAAGGMDRVNARVNERLHGSDGQSAASHDLHALRSGDHLFDDGEPFADTRCAAGCQNALYFMAFCNFDARNRIGRNVDHTVERHVEVSCFRHHLRNGCFVDGAVLIRCTDDDAFDACGAQKRDVGKASVDVSSAEEEIASTWPHHGVYFGALRNRAGDKADARGKATKRQRRAQLNTISTHRGGNAVGRVDTNF